MRSYSKKRPPVKAHEGAAQLCRVLGVVSPVMPAVGAYVADA